MDRPEETEKPKSKKKLVIAAAAIALALGAGGFLLSKSGGHAEQDDQEEHAEADGQGDEGGHEEAAHGEASHGEAHGKASHGEGHGHGSAKASQHASKSKAKSHGAHGSAGEDAEHEEPQGLLARIVDAIGSIHSKVRELERAETENERLRVENAKLRLTLENAKFECKASEAEKSTHEISQKLSREAGTKVARTLASIRYKLPDHLTSQQLYTLGVSYFKAHEDEKAAVILSFLTGLEDTDEFKTSRNLLMTGVTWYRLDNLELAGDYLDKVLSLPPKKNNRPFQAQARLWKALLSDRTGKRSEAQKWLTELVDFHPSSSEAKWVNGGKRLPASVVPATPEFDDDASEPLSEHPAENSSKHSKDHAHGKHASAEHASSEHGSAKHESEAEEGGREPASSGHH